MIPYGRQEITAEDIDAVVEVLRSDFLTQGPMVPRFEKIVAEYTGSKYAVAVNSATSALHVACLALDIGPGDRVWTSPITFVASANCARYCGAEIDFVDIDACTYNMSVERLEEKLIQAKKANRLPKAVIPVHLAGQPCDLGAIRSLAKRYNFSVLEDASHAIGGKYKDEPIGNGRYSEISVFSFHPVKIITTAEGGMALTNNPKVAKRMERLRTHGITRDPADMKNGSDGPWYYEQIDLGFNFRMTDIQAALGVSQMGRLDSYVAKRHRLAARYDEMLQDLPVQTPWQRPDGHSAYHLYIVRLKEKEIKRSHREIFELLRGSGIGVNLHYIPVYRQPYYEGLGFKPGYCPEAERYYAEAVTLPLYPGLTDEQQDEVVRQLATAVGV